MIFCKNFMKIALLTGGPSLERGISLNSARSVMDHLGNKNIEIVPIYFNQKKKAFKISCAELYSNNPSDFDFKLTQNSLSLSQKSLIKLLKSVDIVFPAIHGSFGEDGQIQTFLEKNEIPCFQEEVQLQVSNLPCLFFVHILAYYLEMLALNSIQV